MSGADTVVAPEVCEAEFARFAAAMDLSTKLTVTDEEDKKSLAEAKKIIFDAMSTGKLVIDTDGRPIFTPSRGDTSPLTFSEPTGATYIKTDKYGEGQNQKKMLAVAADLTGTSTLRFEKMLERDLKVCRALVGLFLG